MSPIAPVTHSQQRTPFPLISLVLPVFNEAANLESLQDRIDAGLSKAGCRWEVIYVNDGSTDGSRELLSRLAQERPQIRCVHLSRNFGKQAAIHAGLAQAKGDATIVMDSDMRDEPACLGQFIEAWRNGADVAFAIEDKTETRRWNNTLGNRLYRWLNRISNNSLGDDPSNFGLIDQRVVREILQLREADLFFPGLRAWVGFRQTGIIVQRTTQPSQKSKLSDRKLLSLVRSAIVSSSSFPALVFYTISAASFAISANCLSYALISNWLSGQAIPNWTSTVSIAAFFAGLNALGIAVLCEYLVRIQQQVLGRPAYIVDRIESSSSFSSDSSSRPRRLDKDSIEKVLADTLRDIQQIIREPQSPESEVQKVSGSEIDQ